VHEAELERATFWLVVVPFSFPIWLRMRRHRPAMAEQLRWAFWLNVAQSVLCVIVVVAAVLALIAIPPLVAGWSSRVIR
jgi:hypothetical protein